MQKISPSVCVHLLAFVRHPKQRFSTCVLIITHERMCAWTKWLHGIESARQHIHHFFPRVYYNEHFWNILQRERECASMQTNMKLPGNTATIATTTIGAKRLHALLLFYVHSYLKDDTIISILLFSPVLQNESPASKNCHSR